VGRVDLLESLATPESGLDLSKLLLPAPGAARRFQGEPNRVNRASTLNDRLLADASLAEGAFLHLSYAISNRDRTVGARLAGELARRHGDAGLPEGSLELAFTGYAGQSFGAFGVPGLNLTLYGQANDYVGKGLTGGRLVLVTPKDASDPAAAPVMAGNTVLYGATGGTVFIGGRAGERFGVRNSGAVAVVEGMGDHGCEYMTGGLVISLGPVGYNFGAGMSGGLAFVLDAGLATRLNPQMVRAEPVTTADLAYLRVWIEQHALLTASPRAAALLAAWETVGSQFARIVPKDQPNPVLPIPLELPALGEPVRVR
jgi:glutamate synthase domain-containing protein 3